MAQNFFATLTAPQLALLDANFTELYGFAKNLVSTAGGNVVVGDTVPIHGDVKVTFKSTIAGFPTLSLWNTATSGDNGFINFGTEGTHTYRGGIGYNRAGGLVAYNTTSDYRAKQIHGPVADAGAVIEALRVYTGTMIGATLARPMFIAHEVAEVAPYAVTGQKDATRQDGSPVFQQLDVSSLVPLLVAELQSLRARVAALEA